METRVTVLAVVEVAYGALATPEPVEVDGVVEPS
jgi:hypothetical protein